MRKRSILVSGELADIVRIDIRGHQEERTAMILPEIVYAGLGQAYVGVAVQIPVSVWLLRRQIHSMNMPFSGICAVIS